ncbi:unnamed protein product [Peniophora sp. CBMAI 1063]|nr:unnamed protein product [Peniophora sp. CBMAI 1063]
MGRFSTDDNPRPRKRYASSKSHGSFLTNITNPKTSATTFFTPTPKSSASTFTFSLPASLAALPRDDNYLLRREDKDGRLAVLNGVLAGLGEEKLAAAFKTPFHGVSLDDAPASRPTTPTDTGFTLSAGDGEPSRDDVDAPIGPKEPSITKRIRKLWDECPIIPWKFKWRELYVREHIRRDGRAEALGLKKCPHCGNDGFPEYRCEDCRGADLCKECIVFWHRYSPLHKIERFNASGFYERVSGADLGIRVQVLHRPGDVCKFRTLHSVERFTIIHTNGIHNIPVDFCNCEAGQDIPYHIQLLRWGLWPATCSKPETATTFEALDMFSRLSLLGRLSLYDFYRALEAATDGAMIRGIACVREQLADCVRQFRHVMMFKRAGRGHEPGGIAGTPPGACAVPCIACPNLKLNMPENWASRPFQWLYRVILAVDANFRLSNKLVGSTVRDPNLTDGGAYLAPWQDYARHIKNTIKELAQKSTCSRFAALEMADTRGGKGQRSTGVAGVVCARHEMVQPLGIAPLRKGERYESVDWALCGALSHIHAPEVTISYDIVCQYSVNLGTRLARILPTSVIWPGAQVFAKLASAGNISFVVPKFHLYAHKVWCQLRYAFLYLRGVAMTDGEAPERLWSSVNSAAPSLKEMSPGGNNDVMDDIFGAYNWMKTCTIGLLLRSKMDRALHDGRAQTATQTDFTAALRTDHPVELAQTELDIGTWDVCDKSRTPDTECPYYVKKQRGLSIPQIALQTEAAKRVIDYHSVQSGADDPLSACIELGMEIEDERFAHALQSDFVANLDRPYRARIASQYDGESETSRTSIRARMLNGLTDMILRFRVAQKRAMPSTYAALTDEDLDIEASTAMIVRLCLPSDPADGKVSSVSSAARAAEAKLRWKALEDTLESLTSQLLLKGCLQKHRIAHYTGQRAATRAQTTQAAVNSNIRATADDYKRHWSAYLALEGKGSWQMEMRELRDSDCRCLGDRMIEQMEKMSAAKIEDFLSGRAKPHNSGDTAHNVPWIWYNCKEKSVLEITDELMREWAKSRARAQHWLQEVRLLDAEMQRAIDSSEAIARLWDERRDREETIDLGEGYAWASDASYVDGKRAYASKQAFIRRAQATKWRKEFAGMRKEAAWFLTTHTEEGIALDPATLLPPEEIAEMQRLAHARSERRTAVKRRGKYATAEEDDHYGDEDAEDAPVVAGDPRDQDDGRSNGIADSDNLPRRATAVGGVHRRGGKAAKSARRGGRSKRGGHSDGNKASSGRGKRTR